MHRYKHTTALLPPAPGSGPSPLVSHLDEATILRNTTNSSFWFLTSRQRLRVISGRLTTMDCFFSVFHSLSLNKKKEKGVKCL